jgi:hypothetical protein
MKKVFVTTLNKKLFDKYARNLFETYTSTKQTLPLYAYVEDDVNQYPSYKNVIFKSLFEEEPESQKFAERHKNQLKEYVAKNPGVKEFRYDAVRFSYKVFAQNAVRKYADHIFWIDADCIFNKQIPDQWFNEALPDNIFLSFFDRPKSYTETGFVGINNSLPVSIVFFEKYLDYYINDKIFELPGYLDCDVFDDTRKRSSFAYTYKEKKLGDGGKAHIMARDKWFSEYLDHKKGARKDLKHSPEWEKFNVR